ncbi:MAG: DUF1801 domain-containing protein [Spirochaetota bacterium]
MGTKKAVRSDPVIAYSKRQPAEFKKICEMLRAEIEKQFKRSMIFYANPAWFIDDNPVVGYNVGKTYVNLLFWSGQSLPEPGLTPAGKFKAAQIKYTAADEVDTKKLRVWLTQAKRFVWDYARIRERKGRLTKYIWKK